MERVTEWCSMDDCVAQVSISHEIEWDPKWKETATSLYEEIPKAKQFPIPHLPNIGPRKPPQAVHFYAAWTKLHGVVTRHNENPYQRPHGNRDHFGHGRKNHTEVEINQNFRTRSKYYDQEQPNLPASWQSKDGSSVLFHFALTRSSRRRT